MDDQVLPSGENFSDSEEEVAIPSTMEPPEEEEEEEEEYISEDDMEYPNQEMFADLETFQAERIGNILNVVLPRLPAKSLLRFKAVSPFFNASISRFFNILSHALHPKRISGLFYHRNGSPCYVSLNDDSIDMPDPSLSFMPEKVTVKASTYGILCLRGSDGYYVANPVTMDYVKLPEPSACHGDNVAVVVLFEEPCVYNFDADYRVVCAFPVIEGEGAYMFETFSSSTWTWTMSSESELYYVENIVPASGVAVGGLAYWRTTMQTIVEYNPREKRMRIIDFPIGVDQDDLYEFAGIDPCELGEMEGYLTIASKSITGIVNVQVLETIDGNLRWRQKGEFRISAGNLEGSGWIFRSQGKDELVIWEVNWPPVDSELVLRNIKGTKLRNIDGPEYCADFVPFIGTLLPVKKFREDITQETCLDMDLEEQI